MTLTDTDGVRFQIPAKDICKVESEGGETAITTYGGDRIEVKESASVIITVLMLS